MGWDGMSALKFVDGGKGWRCARDEGANTQAMMAVKSKVSEQHLSTVKSLGIMLRGTSQPPV